MLKALLLLFGIFVILVTAETLWHRKTLRGEQQRKFVHIFAGIFIAFWPWLVSWRTIQLMGTVILVGVLVNRKLRLLRAPNGLRSKFYSDAFYALAVISCAAITTSKVFFALAMFNLALADGLAAVAGKTWGKGWHYKIFGHDKTVIGSMVCWFAILCILGVGLLFAHDQISYGNYAVLLVTLPPVLTLLENVAIYGTDNIVIPIATIIALNLSQ